MPSSSMKKAGSKEKDMACSFELRFWDDSVIKALFQSMEYLDIETCTLQLSEDKLSYRNMNPDQSQIIEWSLVDDHFSTFDVVLHKGDKAMDIHLPFKAMSALVRRWSEAGKGFGMSFDSAQGDYVSFEFEHEDDDAEESNRKKSKKEYAGADAEDENLTLDEHGMPQLPDVNKDKPRNMPGQFKRHFGSSTRTTSLQLAMLKEGPKEADLVPDYEKEFAPTVFQIPATIWKTMLDSTLVACNINTGIALSNKDAQMAKSQTVVITAPQRHVKDTKRDTDEEMGNEKTKKFDQLCLTTTSEAGDSNVAIDILPDGVRGDVCTNEVVACKRGAEFKKDDAVEVKLTHLKNTLAANHLVSDWFVRIVKDMPVVVSAPLMDKNTGPAGTFLICTSLHDPDAAGPDPLEGMDMNEGGGMGMGMGGDVEMADLDDFDDE